MGPSNGRFRKVEINMAHRIIKSKLATSLAVLALSASAIAATAAPASASGYAVTPGPPGCANQTKWVTSYTTSTYERLYVATVGQCPTRTNSCRYGLSVWYNDVNGVRRNAYTVNDNCTWSPYWWLSTPYFNAKRGTSVQVTVRWEGTWYGANTFWIK